jgi:hypothetical protein
MPTKNPRDPRSTASPLAVTSPSAIGRRITAIQELGKLKQLRKLDLNNTNFGDDSARAFVGPDQLGRPLGTQ